MCEMKKERCLPLKVLCSKAFIITVTVILGIIVGLTVLGIDIQSNLKMNVFPFLNGELVANIYNALAIDKVHLGRGYIFMYLTLIFFLYIIVIGSLFANKFVNKIVGNKGNEFKSEKAAKGFMYFFYYLLLAFLCIVVVTVINFLGKYNGVGTFKRQTAVNVLKIIALYFAFVAVAFGIFVLVWLIVKAVKKKNGSDDDNIEKTVIENEIESEHALEEVEEADKDFSEFEEAEEEQSTDDCEDDEYEEENENTENDTVIVGNIEGQEIERLSRSFMGKLCQVRHEVKDAYDDIRAQLLSFKKVNSRLSWSSENFNLGRKKVAKIDVRGKTVILYLALDPTAVDSKYHAKDKSEVKRFADTPVMIRIRSKRGLKFAIELIDKTLEGVEKKDNYVPEKVSHTLKTDKELLELGLAKKVKSKF